MKVYSATTKVNQNYKWDYFYCVYKKFFEQNNIVDMYVVGDRDVSFLLITSSVLRLLWCRVNIDGPRLAEAFNSHYYKTNCLDPCELWGWIRTRRCVLWGRALVIRRQWWKMMIGAQFCLEKRKKIRLSALA